MIQNILTGFFIGLACGIAGALVYITHRNNIFETSVRQTTNEYNQLVGRYNELEQRYSVMQATKAAKVTPQQLTPAMYWIGPESDGSQNFERFGSPEQ